MQYPEHRIQSIHMDNLLNLHHVLLMIVRRLVFKFNTQFFHTQNSLAESLIKRAKLIARPLLMDCKLPTSCWGHALLYAAV